MSWKELTIGKKIATGFGIVLFLLVVLGILSFTGVGGIVKNAKEVIAGKALDGQLAQKEVDHLNWISEVNALLTDDSITELHVQTDYTKCAFGKWLYGPERQAAEKMIPSLAPLFKEIEEPHKQLHESAIEIKKIFKQADSELPGFIAAKENDHLMWAAAIREAILGNHKTIDVQTNYRLCAFGKWLYSDAAQKTAQSDSQLASLLADIKEPHERLHNSAIKIIEVYRQIHPGLESTILKRLDDHRRWAASLSESLIKNSRLKVEVDPTRCAFGRWLASDEARTLMAGDPKFRDILERIHKPHEGLHHSAVEIDEAIRNHNLAGANRIFLNETKKHLADVSGLINQAIEYEDSLVKGRNHAIQIFESESKKALEETKADLDKLQTRARDMLEGERQATQIYAKKTAPSLKKVQHLLGGLRAEVKKNMLTDAAMLQAASGTKRNVAILSVIAVFAGAFLSFVIARAIISALNRISSGMGEGAEQVASAAGQVSSSSQAIASGASQQAASIEETSSSMEEMASMTRRNAENAKHADGLMKEANTVVSQANQSMEQLTQSMEDISKASDETSKIIKTIDEIAFQTNLLALNAAVEAARAGEAGAGFAVVADEVRNLAMRAADAAKNTAELIDGTVKKINAGSDIVTMTNDAFGKVAESSEKVGGLIAEISEASNEQSKGIEQVNLAVSEMDKIVQQNAANAEETASASEEMNAQAEQLRDYVMDLIHMVQGRKAGIQRSGGKHGKKSARLPEKKLKRPEMKTLSHDTKEVRPDQVIPFDEEEGFEDF